MDWQTVAILAGAFFAAGAVKGVVGLGLPTVSLALLCIAFDISTAMALLLAPSLLTNIWQSFGGSSPLSLFRTLWPFYCLSSLAVGVGVHAFGFIEAAAAEQVLGLLLVLYSAVSIFGLRFTIPEGQTGLAGGMAGLLTGMLTGMTGSFVVPSVMFLQSIRLTVSEFAQATGLLFSLLTISLGLSLFVAGRLSIDVGLFSMAGVVPAFLGMTLGYRIRARLKEELFRLLLNLGLLMIGSGMLIGGASV